MEKKYTGYKAENRTKIYDGDVLRFFDCKGKGITTRKEKNVGLVYWDGDLEEYIIGDVPSNEQDTDYRFNEIYEIEVIGNTDNFDDEDEWRLFARKESAKIRKSVDSNFKPQRDNEEVLENQKSDFSRSKHKRIIYAVDEHDDGRFRLLDENPNVEPKWTYRRYLEEVRGVILSPDEIEFIEEMSADELIDSYGYEVDLSKLDEICPYDLYYDFYQEQYWRSSQKTYIYLSKLDLGKELLRKLFIGLRNSNFPGLSYDDVEIPDSETLLELEGRLEKLGESVKIQKLTQ